jgi:hypothetical protein
MNKTSWANASLGITSREISKIPVAITPISMKEVIMKINAITRIMMVAILW